MSAVPMGTSVGQRHGTERDQRQIRKRDEMSEVRVWGGNKQVLELCTAVPSITQRNGENNVVKPNPRKKILKS